MESCLKPDLPQCQTVGEVDVYKVIYPVESVMDGVVHGVGGIFILLVLMKGREVEGREEEGVKEVERESGREAVRGGTKECFTSEFAVNLHQNCS